MNRYWTLSDRPLANWPQPDTFELREGPMPEPGPGQALPPFGVGPPKAVGPEPIAAHGRVEEARELGARQLGLRQTRLGILAARSPTERANGHLVVLGTHLALINN